MHHNVREDMKIRFIILLSVILLSACSLNNISQNELDDLIEKAEYGEVICAEIISDKEVALDIANAIFKEEYNSSKLIDNKNGTVWDVTGDNSYIVHFPTSDSSVNEWGISFKFDSNSGELLNHWYN